MRSRVPALALALITAAGCVAGDDAAPTDSPDDSSTLLPDGTRGSMQVRLSGGVVTANYVVRGGRMMWQGDIDLGPATASTTYALAIKGLDHRWPDGIVPFVFVDPFSPEDKDRMRAAAAEWSRLTPIVFHEGKIPGRPFIGFRISFDPGSHVTGIGPDGTGDGDETNVNIHPGSSTHTVMHELGHALGLEHEQMRPDRNDHVIYREQCTDPDQTGNFDIVDSSYKTMGAYDIESIMQYSPTTWCLPPLPGLPSTDHGNCMCYPLMNRDTFDGVDQETGWFPTLNHPSTQDIRVLTRMYEPQLGASEPGDQLGAAMASGDFDGDGIKDLAVGVPGEVLLGSTAALGEVDLYRGTGVGLVAWGVVSPSAVTAGTTPETGAALAAADVNNDGISDLIIGRPGEGPGAIEVILSTEGGGPRDPAAVRLRLRGFDGSGNLSTDPDRFGATIAVGDLTGDNVPDLAIGAPNGMNGSVKSGYVQLVTFDRTTGSLVRIQRIKPPAATQATNDRFGAALAIVDVDDTSKDDLVVGAPGLATGVKSGNVFVYRSGTSGVTLDQTIAEGAINGVPASNGDRFGAALAWSKTPAFWPESLAHGNAPQLFVGAPGRDNGSGRVFRMVPSFGAFDAYTGLVKTQVFGQGQVPGQTNQDGDAFGSELALTDIDRDGVRELVVAVPRKDLTSGFPDAGAIDIFTAGSDGTYNGVQQVIALNNLPFETWGPDRFGTSLATGDFDSDDIPDLVVGAPQRGGGSGRIYVHSGPSSGVIPTLTARFDQDTASPE